MPRNKGPSTAASRITTWNSHIGTHKYLVIFQHYFNLYILQNFANSSYPSNNNIVVSMKRTRCYIIPAVNCTHFRIHISGIRWKLIIVLLSSNRRTFLFSFEIYSRLNIKQYSYIYSKSTVPLKYITTFVMYSTSVEFNNWLFRLVKLRHSWDVA